MRYKDMILQGQKRQENILYAVLWTMLFAAPILAMMFFSGQKELGDTYAPLSFSFSTPLRAYDWQSVFNTWKLLLPFFVVFLVHNFFLAPILVYGSKRWKYFSLLCVLLIGMMVYQCFSVLRPRPMGDAPHDKEPPMGARPFRGHDPHGQRPKEDKRFFDMRVHEDGVLKGEKPKDDAPPTPFGSDAMANLVITAMLLGLNIGAKYYFKTLSDRKRLQELEHENLMQQMEYLKYQVNPHFFMNTLNNIHALVDIDPEQAKVTIEQLSKLMRYILYESNQQCVPLEKELAFICLYIDIMRIRYTDKVRIDLALPGQVPDVKVPPLLFIIFVENAFKHGVSYERDSFIDIRVTLEGERIELVCNNSRKPNGKDTHGGVGLQNVIKRLQLIYQQDYRLGITTSKDEYHVKLNIPYLTNRQDNEHTLHCNR